MPKDRDKILADETEASERGKDWDAVYVRRRPPEPDLPNPRRVEVDDLGEFLLARLDEDETIARQACLDEDTGRWHRGEHASDGDTIFDSLGEIVVYDEGRPAATQQDHIAHHDPARVLAEVDAKRHIVEWCTERDLIDIRTIGSPDPPRPEDFVPGERTHPVDSVILRWLALPYAGHSDFRKEWRP